jgi:predicted  nucleic acid-binding Zn-ribbon protein
MREDLSEKQQELGASKETEERLRDELARRREELQKIETLDEKIGIELASLRGKMDNMRREMDRFANLDALRAASDEAQDLLAEKRDAYRRRREAALAQSAAAAAKLDDARKELATLPKAKELAAGEDRIRQYEKLIFAVREDIATKARATDFESIREQCLALLSQVNQRIIQAQKQTIQFPK